jgi:hypothetical protein
MFDNCETLDGNEDARRNDQEVAGETAYQDVGLGLHDRGIVRSRMTIPRNGASRKRTVADDRLGSMAATRAKCARRAFLCRILPQR